MALLNTPEKADGFMAPDFSLRGTDSVLYDLDMVMGEKGLVVMFICNHCPYVKGIISRVVADSHELIKSGIGVVAIMPNDTVNYPADSFENMVSFAKIHGFEFPYLIDETQEVAKAYDAVCTPDIYGFDKDKRLQYRGRWDSAGAHEASNETVREAYDAMMSVAAGDMAPEEQFPSMGCSIKWKNS